MLDLRRYSLHVQYGGPALYFAAMLARMLGEKLSDDHRAELFGEIGLLVSDRVVPSSSLCFWLCR